MKRENGITLIALIITIIVMLILVGVTINFVINGGIITRSKQASIEMQKAADREELELAVISSMDYFTGKVVRQDLVSSLRSGWNVSNQAPYTCTSPSNNVFTVTEDGVITEDGGSTPTPTPTPEPDEEDTEDLNYLKTYFMGAVDQETGERPKDIAVTSLMTETSFTDENVTLVVNSGSIAAVVEQYDPYQYYYIRYNNVEYKLKVDATTFYTQDVISLKYNKNGLVGRTATIDGEQYVVLYDAGEKDEYVQLVSVNVLEEDSVSLSNDTDLVDWTDNSVISEANIYNDTDQNAASVLTDIEKHIYLYNNAITLLNEKCEDVVGNTNSDIKDVRCVGSNPSSKNSKNTTLYTSSLLQTLPSSSEDYSPGACDEKLYSGDENYASDVDRMQILGIFNAENSKDYWFASCMTAEDQDQTYVYFGIRCIYQGNFYSHATIVRVRSSSINSVTFNAIRSSPSNIYDCIRFRKLFRLMNSIIGEK